MTGTEGEYLLNVLAGMPAEDIGDAIEHLDRAGDRLARAMAYARRYQLERRPDDLVQAEADLAAAEGSQADRALVARMLAIHSVEATMAGEALGLGRLRELIDRTEDDSQPSGIGDALDAMAIASAALSGQHPIDAEEMLAKLARVSVPDDTPAAALLPIVKAALEAEKARDDPAASKPLLDQIRAARTDPRLGGTVAVTIDLMEASAMILDASQRHDVRTANEAVRRLHVGLDRLPNDQPALAALQTGMRQGARRLDDALTELNRAADEHQGQVLARYAEATAAAARAARRDVARGDIGAAVAVLETCRGLLFRAATGRSVEARLTRPPSLDEIRAGLGALGLDALVHLVPTDANGDGLALVVTRDEAPFHLPLPLLVPRPAVAAPPSAELYEWAWRVAVDPLLRALPGAASRPVRLALVVPGVLGAVPWHAARSPEGGYAIQRAAFSYTVSARLLCAVAWRQPAYPGTGIVHTVNPRLIPAAVLAGPVEADVVTLEREAATPPSADPVFDLPAAFLAGGARTAFAAAWPAPGPAGPLLAFVVEHFRREGHPPAEALRRAQLWMLDPDRAAPGGMPDRLGRAARDAGLAEPAAWAGVTHHGR